MPRLVVCHLPNSTTWSSNSSSSTTFDWPSLSRSLRATPPRWWNFTRAKSWPRAWALNRPALRSLAPKNRALTQTYHHVYNCYGTPGGHWTGKAHFRQSRLDTKNYVTGNEKTGLRKHNPTILTGGRITQIHCIGVGAFFLLGSSTCFFGGNFGCCDL